MNEKSWQPQPENPDAPPSPAGEEPAAAETRAQQTSPRFWLPLCLLALTVLTTLAVGSRLAVNYQQVRPAYTIESDLNLYSILMSFAGLLANPAQLLLGIPFSLTLLGILLAHELGHFFTCRHYRIQSSYPYFIPAPTLLGTMGAFLRIESQIVTRRALFDVGLSGPLVGFAIALPVLLYGISSSKVIPLIHIGGVVELGNPPLVLLLDGLFFPGISPSNIYLHPVARAAWVGLFATAMNLLPVGQLDGGHILYSLFSRQHRIVSLGVTLLLLAIGLLPGMWIGWTVWGVLLLLLGLRHPSVMDPEPLGNRRRWMAALALALLFLCFTPVPFATH